MPSTPSAHSDSNDGTAMMPTLTRARSRNRSHSPSRAPGASSRSRSPTSLHKSGRPPVTTPASRQRRRAYSWRGESPPYESPAKQQDSSGKSAVQLASERWLPLVLQEARCVATLVAGTAVLQCSIALLLRLASFAYPLALDDASSKVIMMPQKDSAWWKCIFTIPSIIAGCLIRVIPNQVISNNFPGFLYASAWLLMGIKGKLGSLPHIPSRICEACLGRLSAIECLVVVLAQLVCTVFTVAILQYSNNTGILVLPPIEYTGSAYGDGNPWIVDYVHELCVNTIFTVALQVVPVLLKLNRVSPWLTFLFVYPLYTYGVDSAGKASTLSPSFLFALSSSRQHLSHLGRCVPQVLSGVLAGKIMRVYFPDDSYSKKRA